MLIKVTISGASPLLLHRFTDAAQQAIVARSTAAHSAGHESPREQARSHLYLDSMGRPVFPASNFFSALIDAGRFLKAGKSKLTTNKSSLVPGGLMLCGLEYPVTPAKWEVDSRPVVVPATGGRVIRHRPRFDAWGFTATLDIDETVFAEKLIRELVDIAGQRIGLGDFRPARKGPFGRFKVDAWRKG